MSVLTYGLYAVEQGETNWRLTINKNLENIYAKTEEGTTLDGKSLVSHSHTELLPVQGNCTSADFITPLVGLTDDLKFSTGFHFELVDRVTDDVYSVTINNGVIVVTLL